MSLLDDAIREHLALKRSRGADSAEVARQEQEALGPVRREPERAPEPTEPAGYSSQQPTDAAPAESAEPHEVVGEDTSQLRRGPGGTVAAGGSQETQEWGFEDDDEHNAAADDPPSEDVLEETPEFLAETPEHDRLWFEQKPPRDFDFNG